MSRDDILYLLALIVSIFLGHGIKSLGGQARLKQLIILVSGLVFVVLLSGRGDVFHSLVVILGNFVIIKGLNVRYENPN